MEKKSQKIKLISLINSENGCQYFLLQFRVVFCERLLHDNFFSNFLYRKRKNKQVCIIWICYNLKLTHLFNFSSGFKFKYCQAKRKGNSSKINKFSSKYILKINFIRNISISFKNTQKNYFAYLKNIPCNYFYKNGEDTPSCSSSSVNFPRQVVATKEFTSAV